VHFDLAQSVAWMVAAGLKPYWYWFCITCIVN